jgi:hypothetical protein
LNPTCLRVARLAGDVKKLACRCPTRALSRPVDHIDGRGGYANESTVAIGVDTHKQAHVAVALGRLGVQIDSCSVTATPAGYRRLVAWARVLGEPVFGVEGCGSYGAGLVRSLRA